MRRSTIAGWLPWMLIPCTIVSTCGCGTIANVLYAIKGEKVEPEYSGLKGKKVAVVVGGEKALATMPAAP